jgi:glycosyltransferase involved in cell wall biosynthesis
MTAGPGIEISAIIPTLNRCDGLRRSLESLRDQTVPADEYEIIVVDNGSTDDTQEVVAEFKDEESPGAAVRFIREERLGLHFARNAGARSAQGAILAFIDDDAFADPRWLEGLRDGYSDDRIGCVGGKILLVWETEPPGWVRPYGLSCYSLDLGDEVVELRTPGIFGSNFSIRRSLLFQVNGFNPDSFGDLWLGDGETGLLRKVLQTGWKVVYTPKALVWHVVPASRMTLAFLKRRWANQGACNSYTAYRQNRPGRGRLLLGALKQGVKGGLFESQAVCNRMLGSDQQYHCAIRASYHWRRLRYDLRLMYDRQLRELVEKDDWLEDV